MSEPTNEECPLCFSTMPSEAVAPRSVYTMVCCGYRMCTKCFRNLRASSVGDRCPVCRTRMPSTDKGMVALLQTSVDAKRPWALRMLAKWTSEGMFGVTQCPTKTEALLREAAASGDAESQFALGIHLFNEDEAEQAATWFSAAARQGHLEASSNLGSMYMTGDGVAKSDRKAAALLQAAADRNHAPSLHNLGILFWRSSGAGAAPKPRTSRKARQIFEWGEFQAVQLLSRAAANGVAASSAALRSLTPHSSLAQHAKAAALGSSAGQFQLGCCYLRGTLALDPDPAQAVALFTVAAESGNASALFALGCCFRDGTGVSAPDLAKAHRLFSQAAERGHALARIALTPGVKTRSMGQLATMHMPREVPKSPAAVVAGKITTGRRLRRAPSCSKQVPRTGTATAQRGVLRSLGLHVRPASASRVTLPTTKHVDAAAAKRQAINGMRFTSKQKSPRSPAAGAHWDVPRQNTQQARPLSATTTSRTPEARTVGNRSLHRHRPRLQDSTRNGALRCPPVI